VAKRAPSANSGGVSITTEPGGASAKPESLVRHRWRELILASGPRRRRQLAALALALIVGIGLVDFYLGFELSLQIFYIVPVCLAVASMGWRFGVVAAVMSVASTLIGDTFAGARYAQALVLLGNTAFALGTYLAVVWLFHNVLTLQRELEERVRQRTAALQEVIAERERLEKAVLEIGERERRSIGHDLHDGLGQHLTGTALAGQVIVEKLHAQQLPADAADVRKLVEHIEEAIEKTRRLAKGLLLAEIQPQALVAALEEFAADVSDEFRIACEFHCEGDVRLRDRASATNLFHIAKEAVHNAIRHGRARRITISLSTRSRGHALTIVDDGTGLPPAQARGRGLGLSIMAHRAEIIGWQFSLGAPPGGGTIVTCQEISAP